MNKPNMKKSSGQTLSGDLRGPVAMIAHCFTSLSNCSRRALTVQPLQNALWEASFTSDLLVDSHLNSVISYIINLGKIQWTLREYGDQHLLQANPITTP